MVTGFLVFPLDAGGSFPPFLTALDVLLNASLWQPFIISVAEMDQWLAQRRLQQLAATDLRTGDCRASFRTFFKLAANSDPSTSL